MERTLRKVEKTELWEEVEDARKFSNQERDLEYGRGSPVGDGLTFGTAAGM